MSGGVDSSLTACLLQDAGHEVVGMTMRLWGAASPEADEPHIQNARAVAEKLGIEHVVLNLQEPFSELVTGPFVKSYLSGETPSPCVRCNRRIKFGAMAEQAKALGCEAMATGHYVRIVDDDGRRLIRRAVDTTKDQSYFLFYLTQEQLEFAHFPLGEMFKKDVKAMADRLGLVPKERDESQDLCFIPDGDYVAYVNRNCPGAAKSGRIVDTSGAVLGQHDGFFRYTIGQRKGLGLGGGPWYVVRLDSETNTVVVGRREDVMSNHVLLHDVNWLRTPLAEGEAIDVVAQVRFSMQPVPAQVIQLSDGRAEVVLKRDVSAVTPGQAAVFYRDDCVLGGGWIVPPGEGGEGL
jgi:tRNA-specific 2-thiouridylase